MNPMGLTFFIYKKKHNTYLQVQMRIHGNKKYENSFVNPNIKMLGRIHTARISPLPTEIILPDFPRYFPGNSIRNDRRLLKKVKSNLVLILLIFIMTCIMCLLFFL